MSAIVRPATVDRIASVVKEVTGRLRVNGFDVVGLGTQLDAVTGLIHVQVQADTTLDTHRIAYYLGCRSVHIAGGTCMYDDVKLVGVPAMVSVFGPAPAGGDGLMGGIIWPDVPNVDGQLTCPMPNASADGLCGADLYLNRDYSIPLLAGPDANLTPKAAVSDGWEVVCVQGHIIDAGCEEQDGRIYDHHLLNRQVARIAGDTRPVEGWKSGDPCRSCGSLNTFWLSETGGSCGDCGRTDADETLPGEPVSA